jgi:hypothetical protein
VSYRYIDDVLSINNSRFAEFLPLIYPPELEVKETTDTASSASFLDLYLEFDDSGQLSINVSVVSLTSSSGGYINGRNSANLELLIDKTSSIYLYVNLKALAS